MAEMNSTGSASRIMIWIIGDEMEKKPPHREYAEKPYQVFQYNHIQPTTHNIVKAKTVEEHLSQAGQSAIPRAQFV
jgi:hypothetical protein